MSAAVLLACLFQGDVEAPIVGRPADWPFTGAVARFARVDSTFLGPFTARASASHRTLETDQALVLTVEMEARGPVLQPPERIDLREIPAFALLFHIQDAATGAEEATPGRWRWAWRLVPKGEWVREVPGVPLVYYNPDLQPPERGYQLLWTDPLPVTVSQSERVGPVPPRPDEVTTPVSSVGRRPWPEPGLWAGLAALLLPPAACVAAYFAWRRLYPDAARLAELRRNRAARLALDALGRLPREAPARAEAIAGTLAAYLRDRLGLAVEAPTPDEAASVVPGDLAPGAAALWRALDAARFADGPCPDAAEAVRLVRGIEEASCPPSS